MSESEASKQLELQVEAALMVSDKPVAAAKIAEALGQEVDAKQVTAAIAALNEHYDATGRSFRIEQVAGGWQMLTRADFGQVVSALQRTRATTRLTPAAMETLAIVAYRQPVLRADVEAIRGVASGEVLRSLMERKLVKIVGRAEELGRPMLYGTTKRFLEVFGLSNLKDLPPVEQWQPRPPTVAPTPPDQGGADEPTPGDESPASAEADHAAESRS